MPPILPIKKVVAIAPIFEKSTYTYGTLTLEKPDQYKGRTTQGIVKYTGNDCEYVKPLDYVFYSAWTGTLWEFEGEVLILMPERFIVARLNNHFDNIDIPGLYFKGKSNDDELSYRTETIIRSARECELTIKDATEQVITTYKVLDRYWSATYSQAIDLITQALEALEYKEVNPMDPELVTRND